MIPELGHISLIIALILSFILVLVPSLSRKIERDDVLFLSFTVSRGIFLLILLSFMTLIFVFLNNDFTVLNAANNSNSLLPWYYRIAATWGSHEGSLLLWILMLATWMLLVSIFNQKLPLDIISTTLSVMGFIMFGFLAFLLFTSNPFDRVIPPPLDGNDLNPLLQDPGMVIHPPMLYMGYVGFSVIFAMAIAALIHGKLDSNWAKWCRPWTISAWIFLTFGIALGSWWAYNELGWGGWWFWDPVENASFMPWLTGTALIHSLMVTEKRNAFKAWTVLLAIITFSLSLLGTFLVRSGILTSVHAFATDPKRGIYILIFLIITISFSLILYAKKASKLSLGDGFNVFSKESSLLANNVILISAAFSVLLGTLYPLFLDALGFGKLSVGPPYFEAIFVPIMAPAFFLMGLGPVIKWKKDSIPNLPVLLKYSFLIAATVSILVPIIFLRWNLYVSIGLLFAFWIILSVIVNFYERYKIANRFPTDKAFLGMLLAHFGVAIFIIGVTIVNSYEIEKDVKLKLGEDVNLNNYTFELNDIKTFEGDNYSGVKAHVKVYKNNSYLSSLYPEKRIYNVQQMPMTEAAIDVGIFRDIYVSLGEMINDDTWIFRLYYKPFIAWIWGGVAFMILGGLCSVIYKRKLIK